MRFLLSAIVVSTMAFAPSVQTPAPGALTGRVVTGTGRDVKPVRRAQVTLTGGTLAAPRVTDTDTTGAFRFESLPSGEYKVAIQKPGFVKLESPLTPGATLTMVRGSAIEGVIRDAGGDPIWNVLVTAIQRDADTSRVVAQVRTDDLGHYRLHSLPAGDYYVTAESDALYLQRVFLMQGEKRPAAERGYYPAASSIEDATPVRVLAGRDAAAIDVTLLLTAPAKDPGVPPAPPRPDATGTARIAGRVTDATTGKPIRNSRLLLVPVDGQRLTNWTRTDRQGRFEYPSLIARRYTLRADADRYVTLEFGQKRPGEAGVQIQVKDDETFAADISLPKASAVEGTLVDEFGDPAPRVTVQLARKIYVAGRHRVIPDGPGGQPTVTDDLGHYRVSGVQPGDYYVVGLAGAYVDANGAAGFAPSYYPGSPDSSAATPITVTAGADTQAPFSMVPTRTFTVAGTIVTADGRPIAGRGSFWLSTPDKLQKMDFNVARGATSADGRFFLRNVPQGSYTLQGFGPPPPNSRGPGNPGAMWFGWLPIAVGDGDMDDVILTVTSGTALRGRFVLEDPGAAPPKAAEVRVTALPVEFDSAPVGGGPPPSETHDDLSFEVSRLSGMRRILVSFSTPVWTLKKITVNDRDVTDTAVDFRTKDVDNVEVVLTPRVSRVSGTVSDGKGPVADYTIVIFSSDPTKWIDRSRFVQVARPTQQGQFDVRGLPPDEYLTIALPSVTGSEWQDPNFLQQLRPRATSIVLNEGESRVLDLKLQRRP